ncbi:hypothetical protein VTL71DRAFT_15361, partial [Oculimacula yallundae]
MTSHDLRSVGKNRQTSCWYLAAAQWPGEVHQADLTSTICASPLVSSFLGLSRSWPKHRVDRQGVPEKPEKRAGPETVLLRGMLAFVKHKP